jgi:hypothetical protein
MAFMVSLSPALATTQIVSYKNNNEKSKEQFMSKFEKTYQVTDFDLFNEEFNKKFKLVNKK